MYYIYIISLKVPGLPISVEEKAFTMAEKYQTVGLDEIPTEDWKSYYNEKNEIVPAFFW